MRFLVDQDVPIQVARCLQQNGHEVSLVTEVLGAQTDDEGVWRHGIRTAAIVVTCNRQDFPALSTAATAGASSRTPNAGARFPADTNR